MLSIYNYVIIFLFISPLGSVQKTSAELNQHQVLDCRSDESFSASNCSNVNKTAASPNFEKPSSRTARNEDSNDIDELCASENPPALICLPKETIQKKQESYNKTQINVFIKTPENKTEVELGSNLTLECRFNPDPNRALKIRLKWVREVVEGVGFNQSIDQTEAESPSTIIAQTTRIWTVHRLNGLDLELNDFQASDSGSYFCLAISLNKPEELISDAKIELNINVTDLVDQDDNKFNNDDSITGGSEPIENQLYSQENLSKLLPSLKIFPDFVISTPGESVRFICITSEPDQPDPEPEELVWSFEFNDRSKLNSIAPVAYEHLPYNVTQMGNVLVIWWVSEENVGNYKCSYESKDFNISTESVAELMLRPEANSAPFVAVTPELVRLSPNGSTTVQCEATGYPAPSIFWYRVDDLLLQTTTESNSNTDFNIGLNDSIPKFVDENIRVENIPFKDSSIYCEQHKCSLTKSSRYSNNNRLQVTAISLIHIDLAQAQHQGQYVCRAKNDHGSNQASTLVDIEFREQPILSITEPKDQTIVLGDDSNQVNITFECSIISGKPKPKLKWLRTSSSGGAGKSGSRLQSKNFDNLDLYDLTKISSAGSNITIHSNNNGDSLTLSMNRISIEDEGDYVCLAENEWGRQSGSAHLTVRKPASIKVLNSSPHVVRVNESFRLDCIVSGHPAPIDIEWSRFDRGAFFSLISRNSNNPLDGQERATLKFDRVTLDDSGEYTCNARDYLNSSIILRDTIMVIVEEPLNINASSTSNRTSYSLLPKLIVRPTKVNALVGSNVTLDCLAISGLQPTIVEWLEPPAMNEKVNDSNNPNLVTNIRPYYRTLGYTELSSDGQLLQFGSKLKITNINKAHQGVYQCKGRNKVGVEIAPALLKVYDESSENSSEFMETNKHSDHKTKAKVANVGSNIELKCQVSGVDQPVTSWSRDGLELPNSSVQIKHNLWIQNVTVEDSGLYICSAKSAQPNKVIQAKIRLMVKGQANSTSKPLQNLTAKIVASKNVVNLGDSITLECIISRNNQTLQKIDGDFSDEGNLLQESVDDLLVNTVWTNLHSGQSLFQDNVYTSGNILIIYELKPENSATYRCNYNELTQYTDYLLQIQDVQPGQITPNESISSHSNIITGTNGKKAELKKVSFGSRVVLDCPFEEYHWVKGNEARIRKKFQDENKSLVFESITTEDADIYHCYSSIETKQSSFLVQVLTPIPRFSQKPFSFITLPTISGADHQLDLEVKFLPERDNGLILFNGQHLSNSNRSSNRDFISLGLSHGYLEFRFELGDGTTTLRSHQTLAMNQWHKVIIERNLKGAVMYVDKQLPVNNSSAGKFLNLNLDSVLYVGGHQYFMLNSNNKTRNRLFYGYSRGFQGCISSLKIFKNEINLMARNRGVAENIFECDKPECSAKNVYCNSTNSICQVDRTPKSSHKLDSVKRASGGDEFRCICLPGYGGNRCDRDAIDKLQQPTPTSSPINSFAEVTQAPPPPPPSTTTFAQATGSGGACETSTPCNSKGTSKCQSLTSTSFRCHCSLGFIGSTCSDFISSFPDETSLGFNGQAFLQLRFNEPNIVRSYQRDNNSNRPIEDNPSLPDSNLTTNQNFDWIQFARLTNMADNLNLSFNLQTKSSYGIIFYIGGHQQQQQSISSEFQADGGKPLINSHVASLQTSKSMVANLLSKLSTSLGQFYVDYLSVALVDGHVELSFELGSGVAIIRSTQRVNDGNVHSITVMRSGRFGKLVIDSLHKQEGSSPGKLSVLNSEPDIYLGGLPHIMPDLDLVHSNGAIPATTTTNYLSSFIGCLSNLQINSLGPINLIRSSSISQVKSGRNLVPCSSLAMGHNLETITTTPASSSTLIGTLNASSGVKVAKSKPYQATPSVESDDPDEM